MIYLDAAAQEPLHPAARAVLAENLDLCGDPRRLYHQARRARLLLDQAREQVAEALCVRADEVIFTSSGTDAVHRGLLGLHRGASRGGARPTSAALVIGGVEHGSVRHAAAWAQQTTGAAYVESAVDSHGRVQPESIADAVVGLGEHVVIAVQSANHEVGTVQPVARIAQSCDLHPVFVDACASMGRLPLPSGWQAAAGSAIKWGGPPGVGVLVVRKGARWRSAFPGDDRTDYRSSGFENVAACAAAAAALTAMTEAGAAMRARQFELTARLRGRLAAIPDTDVVGDPVDRLPHLVTASFLYVDGEALVSELDRAGYAVASGSACAASTLEPSAVLAAMGALTHGNVRISLPVETDVDIDGLADRIEATVGLLRGRVGL